VADYDVIVVGGGTAGLIASAGSAGIGARVALVEQNRLGGECLWTGCVPSKSLIASARAVHAAHTADRFGVHVPSASVDFQRVMQWSREAEQRIQPRDSPERFRSLGVDVISGTARFIGDRTLRVDSRVMTAKHIVIATGSKPAVLPIEGISEIPFLTNETIFSLEHQPETLLMCGAGPVGIELAQAFARLGTRVRVLEAARQILPREDEELAALLRRRLTTEGVEILLGTTATHVSRDGRTIRLSARHADGTPVTIEGDTLLVAAGRVPNVASLEIDMGGVERGKSGVVVDERLGTTARGVWAAGDVTGVLRFTHVAEYQARLVVRNAFFPFDAKADYSSVPWVTFTDPELAHVGLTEDEARARHGDGGVRVWRRRFADLDRAIVDDETQGMVKIITDAKGKILGGHILGHGAGNLIGEVTLAMQHGVNAATLATTVHAYPTYPEAIKQAADDYYKSRFKGPVKTIAQWFARH
jgi:pyruvate/2-oxoglutarate dehydrogenase complex dihydrolipoamide dehydrogenase (E3) component